MDSRAAIGAATKMYVFPSQTEKYPINHVLEGEAKIRDMVYVRMLYDGDFSMTYEVWDGKAYFVLKYIYHLDPEIEEDDENYGVSFGEMEDEVEIQMKVAKAGIAPQIEFAFLCDKGGIIVMEKLEFDLNYYLPRIPSAAVFFPLLLELIRHLHSLNIHHGDLHDKNIMFKTVNGEQKLYVIDFGMSTDYSKNGITDGCRLRDYQNLLDYIYSPLADVLEILKLEQLLIKFLQTEFPDDTAGLSKEHNSEDTPLTPK